MVADVVTVPQRYPDIFFWRYREIRYVVKSLFLILPAATSAFLLRHVKMSAVKKVNCRITFKHIFFYSKDKRALVSC